MTKIIGSKIKEGSMTLDNGKDVEWNKCRLSLVQDNIPNNYGLSAEVLMIKKDDFKRITGFDYADHYKLVDKEVQIDYILVENKPVLNSIKIINQASGSKS